MEEKQDPPNTQWYYDQMLIFSSDCQNHAELIKKWKGHEVRYNCSKNCWMGWSDGWLCKHLNKKCDQCPHKNDSSSFTSYGTNR